MQDRSYIVILIVLFASFELFGQLHEDVFPGESGSTLINLLRGEFRPSSVLSYGEAREVMYTDLYNVNDSVTCVYSGHRLYLDPDSPNPIGDLLMNNSANGINCEHTFPQSKGAGSGNPRSDMHHLYPARARVNEARLNYPYANIEDRLTVKWFVENKEQNTIPNINIEAYSELGNEEFEPREDHKGNVARAMFYFYTIYRNVADASFFSGQRETLCQWHYEDPVDSLEWINNEKIAAFQDDKRNPFVLDCSLAQRSYCPDIAATCESTLVSNPTSRSMLLSPNPANDRVHISIPQEVSIATIQLYNLIGELLVTYEVGDTAEINIDISDFQAGAYTVTAFDHFGIPARYQLLIKE